MMRCKYGEYPILFIVTGLLGTLEWYFVSGILMNLKYMKFVSNGLIYIGRNSIFYLCFHQLILTILNRVIMNESIKYSLFKILITLVLLTAFQLFFHNIDIIKCKLKK